MFHKHAAKACGGVQLHVTDRVAFRPYRTGVACLRALRALWPDAFRWREAAYEFRSDVPAIDLLTGSPLVREAIDNGDSLDAIAVTWAAAEDAFAAERRRWFLYE